LGQNNGKKILIAMTGRRDSTVAAYLLKKQGFDCIGISFLFSDEKTLQKQVDHIHQKKSTNIDEDISEEEKLQNSQISKEKLYGRCHISNIEKVSEICKKLDITFYGVNAEDRFIAEVTDYLVGNKLAGKSFSSCVSCNNIKLLLLTEKAKELGCDYIATGHYAKVVANQKSGHYFIHAANDLEHDQSYLLSRLPQETLKNLILPLSETRLDEVEKIMKMIDLDLLPSSGSNKNCFIEDNRLPSLVEGCSSDNLLRKGHIFLQHQDMVSNEHFGIHNFEVGRQNLKINNDVKSESKLTISELVPTNGVVIVSPESDLFYDRLKLQQVIIDPSMDISKPFSGFAKIGTKGDSYPCLVNLKNFNSASIFFPQVRNGVIPAGITVAIYNKVGISAKIILSGNLSKCGIIHKGQFVNYIKNIKNLAVEEELDTIYEPLPENFH
jgi:tRNA-uridine 2-sulfurtransferase